MCRKPRITLPLLLLAGSFLSACSDHDQISSSQASAFEQVAQLVARQDDRVLAEDLAHWIIEDKKDFVLFDLRPAADYNRGHIDGAQNMTLTDLVVPAKLDALPKDRKLILYSQGSELAAQAVVLLRLVGRDASLLLGGYNFWSQHILNPDISPTLADGEFPRVPEQQAIACYFVGGKQQAASAPAPTKPVPAFTPPTFSKPAPPPSHAPKESC